MKLVILFALLVAASLAAGEMLVRSLPNPYKLKHQWMQRHGNAAEILVMGHSQTYYGILPQMLPHAFSLANYSQTFKYDLLLLKQYREKAANLKKVVVPVSYTSFFDPQLDKGPEWYYVINYRLYMDMEEYPWWSKFGFELAHPSVYSGKLRSFFIGGENVMCDSLGHGLNFCDALRNPDLEASAKEAVARHTAKDWSAVEQNRADFNALLSWCMAEGIEPVVVLVPLSKAYRSMIDARQQAEMYRILNEVAAKHGLQYHDYMGDSRFVDEDFYDADHLSCDRGATKFTKILKEDCF